MVDWSHLFLAEVLGPGCLAVDLTCGNGYDSLFLARKVGRTGRLLSIDLQNEAIAATHQRLQQAGFSADRLALSPLPAESGIRLWHGCHSRVAELLTDSPVAVIANLGYLPGGDKNLITRPDTTLKALQGSLEFLADGGRLAVVVYPGHPGGEEEVVTVGDLFAALPPTCWQVVKIATPNSPPAAVLWVAHKKGQGGT